MEPTYTNINPTAILRRDQVENQHLFVQNLPVVHNKDAHSLLKKNFTNQLDISNQQNQQPNHLNLQFNHLLHSQLSPQFYPQFKPQLNPPQLNPPQMNPQSKPPQFNQQLNGQLNQQFNHQLLPQLSHQHANHLKQLNQFKINQSHQLNHNHVNNNFLSQINLPKNREQSLLENFIFQMPESKFYCNACCVDVPPNHINDHIRLNKHVTCRKRLNNQLLAVNLFQISKHYDHQLTDALEKNFTKNFKTIKPNKISDYSKFEEFLKENLSFRFKLTLNGSIPNDCFIKQSDINLNIEILDEDAKNEEENRDVLKLIKNLVKEKFSNNLKILNAPNLDRFQRASFLTQNRNIINLVNIDNIKCSDLIGQYVRFDERACKLMYNIRIWAKYCQLDQPMLASYRPTLIQIMVIYFLQNCKQPVLPNFHQYLKKNGDFVYGDSDNNKHRVAPITDEELEQIKQNWKTENKQTLGELWVDFFRYYLFIFDHEKQFVNITHLCKEKPSKAFSVCSPIDGSVFSVIFNWRLHYERLNRLLFIMYKHSCFLYYPNINADNLERYLQFIFSLENFRREIDFKMPKRAVEDKRKHHQKIQFDLRHLWQLSQKLNFKICVRQTELDRLKITPAFNIRINGEIGYPALPVFCVLCKSKDHFVEGCSNSHIPEFIKSDKVTMDKCALVISYISEIHYKMKTVNGNLEFLDLIDNIKKDLNDSIKSVIPESKLQIYGSILSGFGHTESDLDFALLFLNDTVNETTINKKNMVRRIGFSALKDKKNIEDLQVITNARVPIIKLKYKTITRVFECDISIENRLPFCNTHLLRIYCTIDQRVPKLGLLIKKFTKICQICFAIKGGLNSYAFNVMIIYFLQQCDPPVLPCLQELEADKLEPEYIEGWEVKYFQDIDRIKEVWPQFRTNQKSIGHLLIDFFIFYTEIFDFDNHVISIRQTAKLTKFEKKWTSVIAIEDPFLLSHNLSNALEMSMINYIKSCFILARNHFTTFAVKQFKPSTRINLLYQEIFNPASLRNADLLPFGKGCQVCNRIGHKKINCPELRRSATMTYLKDKSDKNEALDDELPPEFDITLDEIVAQNIQFLSLIEKFENKLTFKINTKPSPDKGQPAKEQQP